MTFDDIINDRFKEDDDELIKAHEKWVGLAGCTLMEYHILLALALRDESNNILELGPGKGASTETFLIGLRRKSKSKLTTVDVLPTEELILATDRSRLTQFTGNTNKFFSQNKQKWDLIFVDADHRDAQAGVDIENSISCISPNGIVVCHDLLFGLEREKTDISRHVVHTAKTFKKNHKLIEQFGNGLGIIY